MKYEDLEANGRLSMVAVDDCIICCHLSFEHIVWLLMFI